jgi:hypothetical protein
MVVTDDVLFTASFLELIRRLAPDAVFDFEALLTAEICSEISENSIEKLDT